VYPVFTPTHTFETAPDLDVLIIAGGPGWWNPTLNATLDYIAKTAPNSKQVLTICTGSALAARAGIMKGRKATANKTSWPNAIKAGPNTTWISHADWVEDESSLHPVWRSLGVIAGLDLMGQLDIQREERVLHRQHLGAPEAYRSEFRSLCKERDGGQPGCHSILSTLWHGAHGAHSTCVTVTDDDHVEISGGLLL
jgi:hypothetical protein